MAGTSTLQERDNARDRYNKAIRPLTKIKDYEKWVTEWELAVNHGQKQGVGATLSPPDWIQDFFWAVRRLTPEWVNSYRIISREQVKVGTLTFREVANEFWAAAEDQAK